MKKTYASSEALLSLPIDQYSRQKWASLLINNLRGSNKSFKILDVGGYKGKTTEFQAKDAVTVCDLYDVQEDGYVKGDGRKLPFKDQSFDFVVSFDTYEHIPPKDRKEFLKEQVRVSTIGVVLAAPFDDPDKTVSAAEVALNQYHKDLYNNDHPWLSEHIAYGIPEQNKTESMLDELGVNYTSVPSNDLGVWSLAQHLYFSIALDEDFRGRVDDVNRFYNRHLKDIDITSGLAYRKIYYISTSKDTVNTQKKYIAQQGQLHESVKNQFISFAMSTFGKKYRDVEFFKNYLEKELNDSRASLESERLRAQSLREKIAKKLNMKLSKK